MFCFNFLHTILNASRVFLSRSLNSSACFKFITIKMKITINKNVCIFFSPLFFPTKKTSFQFLIFCSSTSQAAYLYLQMSFIFYLAAFSHLKNSLIFSVYRLFPCKHSFYSNFVFFTSENFLRK